MSSTIATPAVSGKGPSFFSVVPNAGNQHTGTLHFPCLARHMIVFATKDGGQALEVTGEPNSCFTSALLECIGGYNPSLPVEDLFSRDLVSKTIQRSGGRQVPGFVSNAMTKSVSLFDTVACVRVGDTTLGALSNFFLDQCEADVSAMELLLPRVILSCCSL